MFVASEKLFPKCLLLYFHNDVLLITDCCGFNWQSLNDNGSRWKIRTADSLELTTISACPTMMYLYTESY